MFKETVSLKQKVEDLEQKVVSYEDRHEEMIVCIAMEKS